MMRADSQSAQLFAVLRRHLRREGWTAPRLARHFAIGEATAKRRLAGRGLTLERLEQLAGLVGLTLVELAREAERAGHALARELTLAQERALSSDAFLSFLFMAILGGNPPDELAAEYGVPPERIEAALVRLQRLALIDRLKGGGVRPLVDQNLLFNKTPLRRTFETHMKRQFMEMDFSDPGAVFASQVVKLSPAGAAQLAEEIERHRRAIGALAERDRETALLKRSWYGVLWAARPLDLSGLQLAARQTGAATMAGARSKERH